MTVSIGRESEIVPSEPRYLPLPTATASPSFAFCTSKGAVFSSVLFSTALFKDYVLSGVLFHLVA